MKTNNLLIGLAGIALLAILGIAAFTFASNRQQNTRNNESQKTEMQSQSDLKIEEELNNANFATESDSQVFDEIIQDIEQVIENVDPNSDFEDIDIETEFGIVNQ